MVDELVLVGVDRWDVGVVVGGCCVEYRGFECVQFCDYGCGVVG